MKTRTFITTVLSLIAFFIAVHNVHSATIVNSAGLGAIRNNGSSDFQGVIGFEFTLAGVPQRLTSFGVWDGPGTAASPSSGTAGDGLESAADVGLWVVGNTTPIATATVPIGLGGTLDGEFRYTPITPIDLSTGVNYILGSLSNTGENAFRNPSAVVFDPIFSILTTRHQTGATSLIFPTSTATPNTGFIGPNAQFAEIPPVPEPSTLVLLGLGTLGLVRYARRRKRKA